MFKRYWKDFAIFWGLFIVFVAGVFFFFYLVSAGKLGFMPTFEELENPKNKFATEIYSEDGKILGKYFEGSENRRYMDYKDIPQSVIDALIATEDVRFYDHSGIASRGNNIFANCCVIVLPPPAEEFPVNIPCATRNNPRTSIPL